MVKMTKEEVLSEINDSEIFSKVFNDCTNDNLKDLFLELAVQSSVFSSNERGHVKNLKETSYRLSKEYTRGRRIQNYCMYTLYAKQGKIAVDIRLDGNFINSESIELENKGDYYNGGFEWYRFHLESFNQITEALRLIEYCYKI